MVTSEKSLLLNKDGIVGEKKRNQFRQILILEQKTLDEFSLKENELMENLIVSDSIYHLTSGTVLRIGSAKLRLTFHCEPCKKIKHFVSLSKINHKRGYLACVEEGGVISKDDDVFVLGKQFEEIPYELKDRIEWYLANPNHSKHLLDMIDFIGLSKSYCRAIPNILKKRPDLLSQIIFKGK